ncbi:DUF1854 domain-containing protein [Massilia sp. CF038]|uniref:cyanophycin metabolism-associated DUF1854 family protein n=1 Tax=Massilia sp. CF038 TaxID=1881045 RepID=UPI00093327F3|nr:DUF1854 domain-containing protein [Massilia sp. CF038]
MGITNFQLSRDSFGRLVLTAEDGEVHVGVSPVRAFPIQAPDQGISLVLGDGKEVGWIDDIAGLPLDIRELVQDELEGREFMPEILSVKDVSSFATPCTWYVQTDRGDTEFTLKGEEDIRRIGATSLLVADNHGINFLVRDMYTIDKNTRRILDRFL